MLDCWFVQERAGRGGGLTAPTTQEKSLLHISRSSRTVEASGIPSDINPEKVFYVTGEDHLSLFYYGEEVRSYMSEVPLTVTDALDFSGVL